MRASRRTRILSSVIWREIRNYIKGLSSDELIAPDEYPQLYRKQHRVSPNTYNG